MGERIMPAIIVFTDLDGTLLHPKTYSFGDALPALELMQQRDIPLIICSSKTKAEIEVYRSRLSNRHPFVSENGGGVFIPEGYFPFAVDGETQSGGRLIRFGSTYKELRDVLTSLREQLSVNVRGFGDMSVQEIAALSGLPEQEAALAKMRDFDEPFIFEEADADVDQFLRAIEARGYSWTRGRFYHIIGDNDKGKAATFLKKQYEKKHGPILSIALGDNLNDLPLLRVVDNPVLVRKEDGSYEASIGLPNLIKADGIGPQGWNRVIMRLLAR
jgi:mannosyl-3-phosphoglycerate phosphatase